jgi:hypothetical protein
MSSLKISAYRKAELALAKQIAAFEAMKTDPELRKELDFLGKIDEFLKEHDMTRSKLHQILTMQLSQPGVVSHKAGTPKPAKAEAKKHGPYGERPAKVFTNPHTNETITVKRLDHGTLKAWIAEYGSEVVDTWLQAA